MRLSWKLGRISGIDLYLHPSALLMFLVVSGAMQSGLATIALVLTLFGSIVLHELGHALMARRYGIGTADITLYLFGGVARLERMPRSAGPELLIALAGPAVNFAIVLGLSLLMSLANLLGLPNPVFLEIARAINLWLGLFNLIPAFPMDGGRVLRALLSGPLGRLRATEFAAFLGRALAIGGGVYFLANGMYQAIILAIFVYMAGSMELRQVRVEGRPAGTLPGFDERTAPADRFPLGRPRRRHLAARADHGPRRRARPLMELTPIVELGVDEAYAILTGRLGQTDLPPLDAIENEDWGRDILLSRFESISDEVLTGIGLVRDRDWDPRPLSSDTSCWSGRSFSGPCLNHPRDGRRPRRRGRSRRRRRSGSGGPVRRGRAAPGVG